MYYNPEQYRLQGEEPICNWIRNARNNYGRIPCGMNPVSLLKLN